MTRRFGVEIECTGADARVAATALRQAGLNAQVEGYNHHTRGHWKLVSDASINSRGQGAFELVSPPLRGEEGIEQVRKAGEVLTALGCRVNRSCGFHVHVEGVDLELKHLKRLCKAWVKFEGVIDSFMPESRRDNENHYCRSNKARFNSQVQAFERIDAVRDAHDLLPLMQGNSRFHKLNLAVFWQRGTIEFRHHSGTVEADKLVNWVRFCTAFVDAYKGKNFRGNGKVYTPAIETSTLLNDVEKTGVQVKEFYKARQKALRA